MHYSHIQRSPLIWLLLVIAAAMLVFAISSINQAPIWITVLMAGMSGCFILLAFCFRHLKVEVDDQQVHVQFGPLPAFGKRIDLRDVRTAEPAKSRLIDGWGIHWIPGRGWTYNIAGFECVELTLHQGKIRIGSDDSERLAQVINERCGQAHDSR